MLICNVPFCDNLRTLNDGFCQVHLWERQKFKLKTFKEVLPFWAVKKCPKHGLLRSTQARKSIYRDAYKCKICEKEKSYNSYLQSKKTTTQTENRKLANRKRELKKFNMTVDDYDRMNHEQKGLCAICQNPEKSTYLKSGADKKLSIDHCHASQLQGVIKVRGLICHRCNICIGYFKDDAELFLKAADYLKK